MQMLIFEKFMNVQASFLWILGWNSEKLWLQGGLHENETEDKFCFLVNTPTCADTKKIICDN